MWGKKAWEDQKTGSFIWMIPLIKEKKIKWMREMRGLKD